jgi:lipopolysaccharide biosynthesis protein
MFWARLDALRPLLDLHPDEADFEGEAGQLAGTMAHAIERFMTLVVNQSGSYLASTSRPAVDASALLKCR